MYPIPFTILFCLLAYLIGSISSAVIVCRIAGLPDPRTAGSKNPGATNVLRLGNKKVALITLLGDTLKGVIPVAIALYLSHIIEIRPFVIGLVMLSVFLGHLYPIFFNFKGGKGVATAFGAIITLAWPVGLLLIACWGLVFAITRYSSLAALTAAILTPFFIFWWQGFCENVVWMDCYVIPVSIMSLFLIWKHRSNIERLIKGKEPKTGNSKST